MNPKLFGNIYHKLEYIYRSYFPKQLKNKNIYIEHLKNLKGIEIGGPSNIFTQKEILPIYNYISALDGCNYSDNTVWNGSLEQGHNFKYGNGKTGNLYIAEGTAISKVLTKKYDFVLSCHNLEHFANPLKALEEWKKIIHEKGKIVLVLPHVDKTFDHNRPVTTIEHIINDFEVGTQEDDSTHFDEIIELHDIKMDTGINTKEELRERLINNITNRCAHHHIFNVKLAIQLINEAKMQIISADVMYHNIFILAQKSCSAVNNSYFLNSVHPLYKDNRYPSDLS